MAHFAKIVNGLVVKVIVAEPEFFQSFVDDSAGEWIQTSYNTRGGVHYNPETQQPSTDQSKALRKNFAGIGFTYNKKLDAFIPPKPYPSWVLNTDTCLWECPVDVPDIENNYWWDEAAGEWKLYTWDEENEEWVKP